MAKAKHVKKSTKKTAKKPVVSLSNRPEITAIIFVAVSLFFIAAMYTDGTGALGNFIKYILLGMFSVSAYIIPVLTLVIGSNLIIEKRIFKFRNNYIWLGISLVLLSCVYQYATGSEPLATFSENMKLFYTDGKCGIGGGLLGGWINLGLISLLGNLGTFILYVTLGIICVISVFGLTLSKIFTKIKERFLEWKEDYAERREERKRLKEQEQEEDEEEEPLKLPESKKSPFIPQEDFENIPIKISGYKKPEPEVEPDDDVIITPDGVITPDNLIPPEEDIIIGPDGPVIPETSASSNIPDTTIEPGNQVALNLDNNEETVEPEESEWDGYIENYIFPDIKLLKENKKKGKNVKEQELMNNARKLVDTLDVFGVQVKVLQVTKGPTITRYELQPRAGIKVSKILGLSDDIALNLAAPSVRIEAPIPGKAAIGIEIPNEQVDMVSMREVIDSDEFKNHPSKLAVALGKDISGTPVVVDLAKMPHLLIAGATGSGKSVCINSIITSIMYKADPNEVKLLLIDPKVVELSVYNGIPHLDVPVVTKAKKAAGALSWAVTEMMKRYDMFSEAKVRDIKGYNATAVKKGLPKMPQIVIIIDELADLMMVAPNEVEDSICRIAQLARAAGMHLVIATQRPSVNVITGIIKANIPSRIAFAVSSQIDSRTILDSAGAEKLLGKGDMLYHPYGSSKPTRVQGAFVSDSEVESLVSFVKENTEEHCNHEILEYIEKNAIQDSGKTSSGEDAGDYDDLLPKALDVIMELGQASTSMIQRKLSVGYARAGRIMDQIEQRGIVGPSEGAKPRQILITKEQYLQLKASGIFDKPIQY